MPRKTAGTTSSDVPKSLAAHRHLYPHKRQRKKPPNPANTARQGVVDTMYRVGEIPKGRQRWGLEIKLLKQLQGLGFSLQAVTNFILFQAEIGRPINSLLAAVRDGASPLKGFLHDHPDSWNTPWGEKPLSEKETTLPDIDDESPEEIQAFQRR